LSDAAIESLLRAGPGARYVTATADVNAHLVGFTQQVTAEFVRGDSAHAGHVLVHGRWLRPGAAEAVVTSAFANERGLRVGDPITLDAGGRRVRLTIAGATMNGPPFLLYADWSALAAVAPGTPAERYEVGLRPGAGVTAYTDAVGRADPQLALVPKSSVNAGAVTVIGSSTLLTVLLGVVAALGAFNTVTLNARERRRDLGMLKSIGMTPRQVVLMVVTSMAALGVLGGLLGLPLGVLLHRWTVPAMAAAGRADLPPSMVDVWRVPELAALVLAGVAIAVLGAYLPARSAARLTIATVLHNE
jgi:putative ABC transport system permease protein